MQLMRVISFSESFARLWSDLSVDLGIDFEMVPPEKAGASGVDAVVLLLAAGGAEREALQWLEATGRPPGLVTFMVGGDPGRRTATQAITRGASDYFALPDDLELLRNAVAAAVRGHRPPTPEAPRQPGPAGSAAFEGIVGESQALRRELVRAGRMLPHRNARLLLLGETGTGKEVLARAIHAGGPRREAPFVPVNCSALPANLIESELFGHERGSFTDAHAAKPGLFEVADGGTLFLDEIGELPLTLQAKLLRVLEDGLIRRVGGTKPRQVDVRILAATHEDLLRRVREGTFREDLYFRLSTVVITLPPLRQREDDVVLIARSLLQRLAAEHEVPVPALTGDLIQRMRAHSWPGNVRELRNALERALLLSPPGELLAEELLAAGQPAAAVPGQFPFPAPLREILTAIAHGTVQSCGGNRTQAAHVLEISTKRLRRLLNGALAEDACDEEENELLNVPPSKVSLAG